MKTYLFREENVKEKITNKSIWISKKPFINLCEQGLFPQANINRNKAKLYKERIIVLRRIWSEELAE